MPPRKLKKGKQPAKPKVKSKDNVDEQINEKPEDNANNHEHSPVNIASGDRFQGTIDEDPDDVAEDVLDIIVDEATGDTIGKIFDESLEDNCKSRLDNHIEDEPKSEEEIRQQFVAQELSAEDSFDIVLVRDINQQSGVSGLHEGVLQRLLAQVGGYYGKTQPPAETATKLLNALERDRYADRLRLEPFTLWAFIAIFRNCQKGQERSRGLYLMARTYHERAYPHTLSIAEREKLRLNHWNHCISHEHIRRFTNCQESAQDRRWFGLIVLQMVLAQHYDMHILGVRDTAREFLGKSVLYDNNETLRIICGRILSAMLRPLHQTEVFELRPIDVFPKDTQECLYKNFPKYDLTGSEWKTSGASKWNASEWNASFQIYIDSIWSTICPKNKSDCIEKIHFAQNIVTEPNHLDIHREPICHRTISITVGAELCIFIQSRGEIFDSSIDIPVDLITSICVKETPLDKKLQGKMQPLDLIFHFGPPETNACMVNSKPSEMSTISLTFGHNETINQILEELKAVEGNHISAEIDQLLRRYNSDSPPIQAGSSQENSQENIRTRISQTDGLMLADDYNVARPQTPQRIFDEESDEQLMNITPTKILHLHKVTAKGGLRSSNLLQVDGGADQVGSNYMMSSGQASCRLGSPDMYDTSTPKPPFDSTLRDKIEQGMIEKAKGRAKKSVLKSKTPLNRVQEGPAAPLPIFNSGLARPPKSSIAAPSATKGTIKGNTAASRPIMADSLRSVPEGNTKKDATKAILNVKGRAIPVKAPENNSSMSQGATTSQEKKPKVKSRKSSSAPATLSHQPPARQSTRVAAVVAKRNIKEISASENEDDGGADEIPSFAQVSQKSVTNSAGIPPQKMNVDTATQAITSSKGANASTIQNANMGSKLQSGVHIIDGGTGLQRVQKRKPKAAKAAKADNNTPENFEDVVNGTVGQEGFFEEGIAYQDYGGSPADGGGPAISAPPITVDPKVVVLASKLSKIVNMIDKTSQDRHIMMPQNNLRHSLTLRDKESSEHNENVLSSGLRGSQGKLGSRMQSDATTKVMHDQKLSEGLNDGSSRQADKQVFKTVAKRRAVSPIFSKGDLKKPRQVAASKLVESSPSSGKDEHPTNKKQSARQKKQATPPQRRSPRLAERNLPATATVNQIALNTSNLVDDILARKTPLVAFDKNGPRNQGRSSILRPKTRPSDQLQRPTLPTNGRDLKHPRSNDGEESHEGRPSKVSRFIQGSQHAVVDYGNVEEANYLHMPDTGHLESSPAMAHSNSLRSEGGSRVDANGSPHALSDIGQRQARHIIASNSKSVGKVASQSNNTKVFNISNSEEGEEDNDESPRISHQNSALQQDRQVALSSNSKGQPASPNAQREISSRYVAHAETPQGYIEVQSASVVPPVTQIRDPFSEPRIQKESSNFMRRLKGDGLSKFPGKKAISEMRSDSQERTTSGSHKGQTSQNAHPALTVPFEDAEKTLVNCENEPHLEESCSSHDTSSTRSAESEDHQAFEDDVESERARLWRQSLKPHQMNLMFTLHGIVDDLVRQLIDKESAVEAVVADFCRSGRTLVEEYEKKHVTNRRTLRHDFEEKMKEVESSIKQQKRVAQHVRGKANKAEDPEKETQELEKRQREIGSRLKETRLRSTKRNG